MTEYIRRDDAKEAVRAEMLCRYGANYSCFRAFWDYAEKALYALPAAGEAVGEGLNQPMLRAFMMNDEAYRWWTREGEDLWGSERINGVASHCGSRLLYVDRSASSKAVLALYDADLAT